MVQLPEFGAAFGEIEDLSRVEEPLKGLQQPSSLVPSTLWVDEHQERLLLLGEGFYLWGGGGGGGGGRERERSITCIPVDIHCCKVPS